MARQLKAHNMLRYVQHNVHQVPIGRTTVSCKGIVPRAPTAAPNANFLGETPVKPAQRHKGPLKPRENLCIAPAVDTSLYACR